MIESLINKFLILTFFMACLSVIRHLYYFIQALLVSTEEEPVTYRLSQVSLTVLCVSLSYIISAIITGLKL